MCRVGRPPWRRAVLAGACAAAAAASGCQSYEREPLRLDAYRDAISARLAEMEPVVAFAERLSAAGDDVPATFDAADGLSPAEGEVLALLYNPDLRVARLEAGVTLATFENAGLWQDPVFGFDAADILSDPLPLEYGLIMRLTIPVSGRLGIEKDRAGAAYEAELRRVVDAEWSLRADVRRAWAAWTIAVERAALLASVVEQVEGLTRITDALTEEGELSRVEGRLFRVELADRRAELSEVMLVAERARLRLTGLLGLPGEVAVPLEPALPAMAAPEAEDRIARMIASNTELAVWRARYRVAEETLRLEVRKQYPDLTIGAGYGSEGDDRLLLGASIVIPVLNANRQGIAEARAARRVARAGAERTLERLLRELADAEVSIDVTREQRDRYEREIVPLLGEQTEDMRRIVELGETDTFLLLETVSRQYDAKSRLLELRQIDVEATIALAELLGPATEREPAPVVNVSDADEPGPRARSGNSGGGS